jgi:transcriptional regulator with XRE-family HTH domain
MARAGRALKRVLTGYGISQNQLATTMGIDRSNVSRWVSGSRDPSAEAVAEIKRALSVLRAQAAEDFVQYYLYDALELETRPTQNNGGGNNGGLNDNGGSASPMHLVSSEIKVSPAFV